VIGRMYRRFLADGRVKIRFVAFDEANPSSIPTDTYAQPNDPGYLMTGTSTPAPWDKTPMFELWGDGEVIHRVRFRGQDHEVKVRYSLAREEARKGHNPGAKDHGRHAARNNGLS